MSIRESVNELLGPFESRLCTEFLCDKQTKFILLLSKKESSQKSGESYFFLAGIKDRENLSRDI